MTPAWSLPEMLTVGLVLQAPVPADIVGAKPAAKSKWALQYTAPPPVGFSCMCWPDIGDRRRSLEATVTRSSIESNRPEKSPGANNHHELAESVRSVLEGRTDYNAGC